MKAVTVFGAAVAFSQAVAGAPRSVEERSNGVAGIHARPEIRGHQPISQQRENRRRDVEEPAVSVGIDVSGLQSAAQNLASWGSKNYLRIFHHKSDGSAPAATSGMPADCTGVPPSVVTVTRTVSFTVSASAPGDHNWPHRTHSHHPGGHQSSGGDDHTSSWTGEDHTSRSGEDHTSWGGGHHDHTSKGGHHHHHDHTSSADSTQTQAPDPPASTSAPSGPMFPNSTITLFPNTTSTAASTSAPANFTTPCQNMTTPLSTSTPLPLNSTSSWSFSWNASLTSTTSSFLVTAVSSTTTKPSEDPCTDDWPHWSHNATRSATATASSSFSAPANTSVPVTESPCPEESASATSTLTSTSAAMSEPCDDDPTSTSSSAVPTTTTEPCDDDPGMQPSSTVSITLTTAGPTSWSNASSTTVYSSVPSTTSCVIDTSITPIVTAPVTTTLPVTVTATTTVCATDAPTGPPQNGTAHCGVHGLPVGDYFLARFVENAPDEPVSLEGCYQFCSSVWGDTHGCQSYDYYLEPGLGAPRCDLYGSQVTYALWSIDNNQPNLWYDLACGDPTSSKWAHTN